MTIKSSGSTLTFTDIYTEFGLPPERNLGAYRAVSQNVGTLANLPLDAGIPQSGTIKFSDFYSKKLNVVVDFYSSDFANSAPYSTRVNALSRYKDQKVTIIGGFKKIQNLPLDGNGKRIIVNVNKVIGSATGNRNYVALKTGNWGTDVKLDLVIGIDGTIIGAGGDGGKGGDGDGGQGGQGSSAIGVQYPVTITNQGVIRAGRGGGGGGAGAQGYDKQDVQNCKGTETLLIGGGGGAGGLGYPYGTGGQHSTTRQKGRGGGEEGTTYAGDGTSGNLTQNGSPGGGGAMLSNRCSGYYQQARSGGGGNAESSGQGALTGTGGGSAGQGGSRGYAIIIDSTGSIIGGSVVGNAPDGDTVNGTSA